MNKAHFLVTVLFKIKLYMQLPLLNITFQLLPFQPICTCAGELKLGKVMSGIHVSIDRDE